MSFLEINNITIGYEKPLLSQINLSAEKKEVIAIVGLNGSGKSTLLKSIAKILPLHGGNISIENIDILNLSKSKASKIIGFSSVQNISVSNVSVFDLVAFGRIPHTSLMGNFNNEDKRVVNEAIESTGLLSLTKKEISKISDGQKQRAFIARLIAQQTDLMLFDEPTAFLDIGGKYTIISLFKQIAKKTNKVVIFSTHDLKIAIQNADKIWLFIDNKIIEGSPEDLILDGEIEQLFFDSNISFNNFTADFNVNNQVVGNIALKNDTNNEVRYIWTKNALNKIGYFIDNQSNKKITIKNNNWILSQNNSENKYSSLYKLLKYIQNVEKN